MEIKAPEIEPLAKEFIIKIKDVIKQNPNLEKIIIKLKWVSGKQKLK